MTQKEKKNSWQGIGNEIKVLIPKSKDAPRYRYITLWHSFLGWIQENNACRGITLSDLFASSRI